MKPMIRNIALAAAALLSMLVGCSMAEAPASPAATGHASRAPQEASARALKAALDHLTTGMLREVPELATSLGVSEELAGGKYSDRLSDVSVEGMDRQVAILREAKAALAKVDRAALSPADAVTYDIVSTHIDNVLAGAQFGYGTYGFSPPNPYIVTQLTGAYVTVPDFLDAQHQVRNRSDADDYIARLEAFARVMDQETALVRAQAARGVMPPDFSINGAITQLEDFSSKPPGDSVLVQALKRKLADAKLDAAAQKELVARAEMVVKEQVFPAYRRQTAAMKELRGKATHDAGVWHLPRGADYYVVGLRNYNTTSLDPEQIHEMGLRLIEQFHEEMDGILRKQGLTAGTVGERMDRLARDKDQLYPNTDAGRSALLQSLNQNIADLQPLLPRYFGTLAKAKLEIRRVPPYTEAGAPGGYYQSGSLDGSRPGVYYINLRDTSEWPKFSLPTLTYHEGEPGHHWQISIAQEATGLPLIRSAILGSSGYWEGWALYAEQLADEMGVYEDDALGRLGYLQSMTFRAARLVVDTGLHYKKWSRERAIDYMVGVTGDQRSSIATEVERYAVWPGQATAYMIGRETINRLRNEAKAALGENFDIRDFHDAVLANGSMPLSVLETVIRNWIAGQPHVGNR